MMSVVHHEDNDCNAPRKALTSYIYIQTLHMWMHARERSTIRSRSRGSILKSANLFRIIECAAVIFDEVTPLEFPHRHAMELVRARAFDIQCGVTCASIALSRECIWRAVQSQSYMNVCFVFHGFYNMVRSSCLQSTYARWALWNARRWTRRFAREKCAVAVMAVVLLQITDLYTFDDATMWFDVLATA